MEKYCRNSQIIDGELEDSQVMMHLEKGKYFGLNPVGKRIWDLIQQPKGFDEIVENLLNEFNVEKERCEVEVKSFLDNAIQNEVIEKRQLD
jgi:Coenzyme PQQ synthesis protein D (PqqD).